MTEMPKKIYVFDDGRWAPISIHDGQGPATTYVRLDNSKRLAANTRIAKALKRVDLESTLISRAAGNPLPVRTLNNAAHALDLAARTLTAIRDKLEGNK